MLQSCKEVRKKTLVLYVKINATGNNTFSKYKWTKVNKCNMYNMYSFLCVT